MSIAEKSLELTGLFESELLVELMLRYWKHPRADDPEYRNILIEGAAEALRAAIAHHTLIEGLPPDKTSLVAAIWYAEWAGLDSGDASGQELVERRNWLDEVRRALPSCFCDPDLLAS